VSHLGRDHMVFGLLLPVKSVPITTNVVSSYPVHDKVYSMQHYVIKFVSDLAAVRWFSLGTPGSSINQTESGVKHHKPKPSFSKFYGGQMYMELAWFSFCYFRNQL
jgi:hypothetical protein